MRVSLVAILIALAACSAAPEKHIPHGERHAPTGFAPVARLPDIVSTTAEVVTIRGHGPGLLTAVRRRDGRFPGIAQASANGATLTYKRLESEEEQGLITEHGLLILSEQLIAVGRQTGLIVSLCGLETCYQIKLTPAAFEHL
ncbi:MAG: hypothetical protein AAF718_05840 [Pseudomonadota bacterium]